MKKSAEPPITAEVLVEQYQKAQSCGGTLEPWPTTPATLRSAQKLVKKGLAERVLAAIHSYAAHLLEARPDRREWVTRPWNWFGIRAAWEAWEPSHDAPAQVASHHDRQPQLDFASHHDSKWADRPSVRAAILEHGERLKRGRAFAKEISQKAADIARERGIPFSKAADIARREFER